MPEADAVNMEFMEAALSGAGFVDEPASVPPSNGNSAHHQHFDVPGFLARNGIRVQRIAADNGSQKYILEECPFDPSHKAPDSAVFVYPNGARAFKCLHNSCMDYRWQDLREKFEPGYRNKPSQQRQQNHNGRHHCDVESNDDQQDDLPLPPTFRELDKAYPTLRPPIVHGLLREGETANLIAATKAGKSWLALGLALSVITGKRWMGRFLTVPGSVLIVDNELHNETITHRIRTVAKAMELSADEFADHLRVESLRGKLRDINGLGKLLLRFEPGQFKLVIVDAFYRTLPRGADENKNADVAAIYNTIDSYAERLKCAFASVHHATKGNQTGKGVTDVGSGAGSFSRAADCHFVLRPHATEKDVAVCEAALRSWPPLEPLALRWAFPLWQEDESVDLSNQPTAGRSNVCGGVPFDPSKQTKFQQTLDRVVDALEEHGPMTKNAMKEAIGASGKTINEALGALLEFGRVVEFQVEKSGIKYPGFALQKHTPDKNCPWADCPVCPGADTDPPDNAP